MFFEALRANCDDGGGGAGLRRRRRRRVLCGLWCAVVLLGAPAPCPATTGEDLSSRIAVDGIAREYAADEWVADPTSDPPERATDSAWGRDNDIARLALTWDREFLYVAVECVTLDSRVFLFIDHTPGGIADTDFTGRWRRSIVFAGSFRPDVLVAARPGSVAPEALRVGGGAPGRIESVRGYFLQDLLDGGAMEVAIPWRDIAPASGSVSLAAVITGDEGTGAGDAVPDPNAALESARTARARIDRYLQVEVDADGDGLPDTGVSPRDASRVPDGGTTAGGMDLDVSVDVRSFVPDDGETVTLTVSGRGETRGTVFESARVYARSGRLVRVLFRDRRRDGAAPVSTPWDGRDDQGRVVPGGIYIVNVTWGEGRGARDNVRNTAVAVVR